MKKAHSEGTIVLFAVGLALWGFNVFAQQKLEAAGPGKMNVAALNLKSSSGVALGECELISDRLRGDLFNTGKVNVMERDQMQEVLKEQGFQSSGACTDEACLVQMGQLLGVQALVTGSLGKVGSMFMVNVRMIDVRTAKIVKVVSVDVKGDIEDVVGKIKDIAEQLVGGASEAKKEPEPVVQQKPKEEPNVREAKEEKPIVEPPKEEKRAIQIPEDERTGLNKNRSGIRVGMNMFFGEHQDQEKLIYYNNSGDTMYQSTSNLNTLSSLKKISMTPLINPCVIFAIKAGPVLAIDLGFGIGTKSVKYQWDSGGTTITWDDQLTLFSFLTGINFVKRWYPFKLNIGIILDANYLNLAETSVGTDNNYGYTYFDTTLNYYGFNVSVGLRMGGEYLIGNHVGISADILFCRSHFETLAREVSGNNIYQGTTDAIRIIDMPVFGLGFGINFYY